MAQVETKIAQGITQKLLTNPAVNAVAQKSRDILSKLASNTAGKFVRFADEQVQAKFASSQTILNNVFGTGPKSIVTGLGQRTAGYAVRAAQAALRGLQNGTVKVPPGLTREAAEAYLEIARRTIAVGKDAVGTQAARAELLDWLLGSGLL